MFLAYIDEIGDSGVYSPSGDSRTSGMPAFGYAGFVIPGEKAREFGACFTARKATLYPDTAANAEHRGRWEIKGNALLYAEVLQERPQNVRVLCSLIRELKNFGGCLFYYADEKPIGTRKQTNTGPEDFRQRETTAMQESLNRLARHAETRNSSILVMMDQINEKSRVQRLPGMYAHILGRAAEHEDMRRIVEPPMHIDSKLSSNIQFADWIAALVARAIDHQLVDDSRYHWIAEHLALREVIKKGHAFTYESKLHFWERSLPDLVHSQIFDTTRIIVPHGLRPDNIQKLKRVRLASQK